MSTLDDISHLHQNLHPAEGAGTGNGVMIPNLVPADLNATTAHSTTAGDNSSSGSSHSVNPTSSAVDNGPVQAYAKLESDTFCYYIRTLQVMLGRKAGSADEVDIHLGSTKGISRQHARLFYNFLNQRFELIVYGKNGAFVNEQFIEKGSTVPLEHRTKVQIGETTFHFLLPKMELEEATHENYPYLTGADEYHQEMKQTQQIPQAIPHQSNAAQSQTSSVQPHKQPEIRHNATAALGNPNIGTNSEFDQTDGAQETPREGETFDTSEYNNKDVKPPFSYASLIAQAINTSPNKKLTLNGIYNYITSHYPYYQMAQNGWQNSIRHNLSLNKAFIKVPRGDNEPGKGAFWTIDASCEGQFRNGVYRKSRRQPSGKVGGGTGPVRPKAGPSTSTPYTPPDPNRRRSTSSKSAAPAAGTPNSAKPVARNDRPAGLGSVAGQMPTAKTTSLLGSVQSTAAYNTSTIPNASTAAAGATVPQVSTTYTPSSYITSNNTLPASNATTAATTLSPAMQLLTAAAALSSPALANMMTQQNATTPQLSATTVTTSKPSSDGSTAQSIPVTGSHATAVAPKHGVDAKTPP